MDRLSASFVVDLRSDVRHIVLSSFSRGLRPSVDISPSEDDVHEGQSKPERNSDPEKDAGRTEDESLNNNRVRSSSRYRHVDSKAERRQVTWNGPDDPDNPRNWPTIRRWAITFITSGFTFMASLSSSMISPALPAISEDLKIENGSVQLMIISIFVLAFAIAPLVLGPLSEIFGRRWVLQISNLFFVIFNTACGGVENTAQLIIFRFFAGLGGSATLAIGGGILADVWSSDERGKAVGIYTLMPLLGPAVGPIVAGFIVRYSDWRWCFYSVSIGDALVQICATIFHTETYPRAILYKRAKRLRAKTGNPELRTEWEEQDLSLGTTLRTAFKRPIKLITTQPLVQFCAAYMAFLYGLMYLVLSTFPRLWSDQYHEEVHIGGLNYISAGLGFFLGSQSNARLQDHLYQKLKARNGGVGKPEFRIPLMMPGSLLVPAGIFIYGWSAEYATFWFWPNLGIFILSGSMIMCFQGMQIFLVETYTTYAASALAAATLVRSFAGFGFPLFATQLQDALGYGWSNSVLGFAACGIGWPAVMVFWKYGEQLRKKSPFAAGGD